ncbi:MAG TPA: D-aminoacyl-tRNA deacylase [Flavipsychrobacter sp.]|jgi:D-tyrosyl-tRNA(Tyr) deacylase|nr:D-aminoacyl-tRNA deacylase [Flavipsychrobacter sp.]
MRVVIQRVSEANVAVNGSSVAAIAKGFLILIGVEAADTKDDVDWLVKKVVQLRVFNDENGLMNLDIKTAKGAILVISQFTLHASYKKGNRPSFIKAARPEVAIPLYEYFISQLATALGNPVASGVFGADMKVSLINDGPVTITMDSKSPE